MKTFSEVKAQLKKNHFDSYDQCLEFIEDWAIFKPCVKP